ncbi:MAG TPA: hypothetical protein VKM35_13600 [Arenimonas sp.]|uniref:sulfotransferase family protein n=1 Tax=Arenimonas sp. TaxID=1872635 RepID=UPI002CA82D3F|nr:hypothetical protein [Arenimonas sp.]HMB58227.1 hypothetical protein [Arenimonas sp.]
MQRESSRQSRALLVLGMHRSGTSALTGSLGLLGVELGDHLVAAAEDNRSGYWENADAVGIHDHLLAALSRRWDDVRPLPFDWRERAAAKVAGDRIDAVVAGLAAAPLWAVKDPRMSRLTPLWLSALDRANCQPACIFIIRHPDAVAKSLAERDGMSLAASQLLWLRHILEAVRDTDGRDRLMLTYQALLQSPRDCLARVAQAFDLRWPVSFDAGIVQIGAFLDPEQCHQRPAPETEASADSLLASLVQRLYRQCLRLADGSADWSSLATFAAELQAFDRDHAEWIAALGEMQDAAIVAREKHQHKLLQEIALLRDRVAALAAVKAVAENMAIWRLAEMEAFAAKLAGKDDSAQARLRDAAQVSQDYAGLGRRADEYLRRNEALEVALADIERLTAVHQIDVEHLAAKDFTILGLRIRVADVTTSLSWRITEPLRKISGWLRSVTKRA